MRYLVTNFPSRKCLTNATITLTIIDLEKAKLWCEEEFKSLLWHETTRAVASSVLDKPLEKLTRRQAGIIRAEVGDEFLMVEYTGPDIPEGATTTPRWW